MKNPHEHDWLQDEVRVGRTGQFLAVGVFLVFLLVPAASLFRPSLRPDPSERPAADLKARLAALDEASKKLPLLEQWRRGDQLFATRRLGAGNQRVFAGGDGWLYYRPDLEAVFGKGPYHLEPPSVAREKAERAWQPPVPVIKDFAAQLAERNIALIFVPVPTKPMVCREGLGLTPGIARPPAWNKAADDLAAAGIGFVDLFDLMESRGTDAERFLKQDTHWTPATMEAAARDVAARIGHPSGSGPAPYRVGSVEREHRGDLAKMLELGETDPVFPPERATLRRVLDPATGAPVTGDPGSDLVLLGDSFVNVFEDPSLGFGAEGEPSIGAGFASHLALALGRPAQVLAVNGGGATAVREAFAALSPGRLAKVKTVVWVLSARDLLLPELPARRANIEWRKVGIGKGATEASPTTSAAELILTLREASPIEDPTLTPYASAIYSALFEDSDGKEHLVFLWAFRDRKLEPSATLEPGKRYRLRLVPLESDNAANRASRIDDLFRPDLSPSFANSFEAVE
jgi:hypothetical protein